ncbi:hypothetical protein BC941DRAFT_434052 [Chlamydoabsidia padenii]|nr:hypothetical protein BC941DRAFT_434052 [Chlamydoabsidia padenii]
MSEKYKNLKVKDLQELLQKNGLPHTGKKDELIERLVNHDEHKALELESLEAEFGNLEEFDDSKLNLDELADSELKSFQLENKGKPSELDTTSADKTNTDKPSSNDAQQATTTEGSGFKFNPIVFDKKPSTAPDAKNGTKVTEATTDAERKLERAKRFGVQVNEKTKQELRAARFGIQKASGEASPGQKKVVAAKGIDPEVLKKRAERFGLPDKKTQSTKSTTTALSPEEEEKKRKRAERFGMDSNKKAKN